jgi:hypothetical protein
MGRFGVFKARFYAPSDLSTLLTGAGGVDFKTPVTGAAESHASGVGGSSFTFVNDTDLNTMAAVGNICWVHYTDALRSDLDPTGVTFSEAFVIKNRAAGPEPNTLVISGPELLDDLKRFTIYRPIGLLTQTNTTLAEGVDTPVARTLDANAATNDERVLLNASDENDVGKEIHIALNAGGEHVSAVTSLTIENDITYHDLREPMPSAANDGNAVELRTVTVRTLAAAAVNGAGFVRLNHVATGDVGKEIRITLDAGAGTHITTVSSLKTEGEEGSEITYHNLRDKMWGTAANGNAVELRAMRIKPTNTAPFQEGVGVEVTLNSGTHETLAVGSVDTDGYVELRDALPSAANAGNAVVIKDYSKKTTNDITEVMAFAQGWSTVFESGTGTANGTRYPGGGETVYDILRTIADETGEFFRIRSAEVAPMGPKRTVLWRRTHDAAGVAGTARLVMPAQADMATDSANINRAILLGRPSHEGDYDPVTQIIPIAGDARITLHSCSAAAVAAAVAEGFNVYTNGLSLYAAPYVQNTALNTSIGIWQRKVTFSEVTVEGDNLTSIQVAADKLLSLAIRYLKEHVATAKTIEAECVSAVGIRAGQKVELYFQSPTGEYTIDYTGANALYVQTARRSVSPDGDYPGAPITRLTLTPTIERPATRDADRIAKKLKAVDRLVEKVGAPQLTNRAVIVGGGTGGGSTPGVTDHGALTGLLDNDHPQYVMSVTNTGLEKAGQNLGVNLKTDSGLVISSGLGLGTPTTLTAATTNAVSGSGHSHAITATTNAKSTVNTVLKGDANGDLIGRFFTLDKLISPEIETASGNLTLDPAGGVTVNDGNLSFVGARSILNDSGSLTLAPVGSLIADPGDDVFQLNASTTLKTANWSSGFLGTGWGVTYAGAADFRSIYADELHVAAFIADTARVKVGAEYITPSRAITTRSMTIPAVSSTATLYVEDVPGFADTPVFAANDWIMISVLDRSGGGLAKFNVWGQVTSYSDLSAGEQSWTFTTRSANAAAVSEVIGEGSTVLDFGKSGDGWLWLTTLDTAGSPYLGITTWAGSDPYTEGNRTHRLRLGQLAGVSGLSEWGLQSGASTSNFIRFSDLRSEIHGSRLSLYAGDMAQLRARAVRVEHYRTGVDISFLLPDSDGTSQGVLSTGASFYTEVDENPSSPTTTNYIYNAQNQSGVVFMGLNNPTWNGSTTRVDIHVNIETTGFSNDTVKLYGQVFQSDELTPLTSEKLIYTATTNTTTTPKVQCDSVVPDATQAQWNAARLRLRWEYTINASEEAIRLDPNVPSIAVGNPLPTDYLAGGAGFWTGLLSDGSAYAVRIGHTTGPNARFDGANFRIANDAGADVFYFPSSGTAYIGAPVNLSTSGGIYQGTGTFASPTAGLKIWNNSGAGTLSTFEGSAERIKLDTNGIQINYTTTKKTASGMVFKDSGGNTVGGIYGYQSSSALELLIESIHGGNTASISLTGGTSKRDITLKGGTTELILSTANDYCRLKDADLYISERGLAVGYTTTPTLNRGQIASDLAGGDFNSLVLQDTTDIAHGMTSIVSTATYGVLGKNHNTNGGLKVAGYGEGFVAVEMHGAATSADTTKSTAALAPVSLHAYKKSGTSVTSLGANENLLTVMNNGAAKAIVDAEGDLHIDGTTSSFDDYNDVALLRAADLTLAGRDIDREYGDWLEYNRADLERLGLVSAGGFVNVTRMQRLITGAVWQLSERISRLEAR